MLVAVVDDDPGICHLVSAVARQTGFRTQAYLSGQEFLDRYRSEPGCVVLGLNMPLMCGDQVLEELQRRGWHVPVVTMSGGASEERAQQTLRLVAVSFLRKPFRASDLRERIEGALAVDRWGQRLASWGV